MGAGGTDSTAYTSHTAMLARARLVGALPLERGHGVRLVRVRVKVRVRVRARARARASVRVRARARLRARVRRCSPLPTLKTSEIALSS